MNAEASRIAALLGLEALPGEGGYFTRIWTSPIKTRMGRPQASAILYLLPRGEVSAFHRLRSAEVWQFVSGDPLELVRLDPKTGRLRVTHLGRPNCAKPLSVEVPANVWQGARLSPRRGRGRGWALVSCTVAPAWDFREFELGDRAALLNRYPKHRNWVLALTRPKTGDTVRAR